LRAGPRGVHAGSGLSGRADHAGSGPVAQMRRSARPAGAGDEAVLRGRARQATGPARRGRVAGRDARV
ncbi:MAG: Transcriptional regulator, IclR family, partial [uncultured Microvirga sp.]